MPTFNSSLWNAPIAAAAGNGGSPVQDLLNEALTIAGVLGPGHTPNATQSKLALESLNGMFGIWNTSRYSIPNLAINLYTLIPQKLIHTIGPGGDFPAVRPETIEYANILLADSSGFEWDSGAVFDSGITYDGDGANSTVRRQLTLLNDGDWAAKQIQSIFSLPQQLYNDRGIPLSGLHLYPAPDQAYPLELYTWQLFLSATAGGTLFLAPGYPEAIVYNLAVRLAAKYRTQLTPEALQLAANALAWVKSANSYAPRLRTEPGLQGNRASTYNYLTGLDH